MKSCDYDLSVNDQIELDQISILVEYIQKVFVDHFGFDFDVNLWDSKRIQGEFAEIFTPEEFTRLMQTEFGRGVLVGTWVNEYILGQELIEDDAIES
jgi:hypothetical protein